MIRPWAEKLLAQQNAANLVQFNDRYNSMVQMAKELERIDGRGNDKVIESKVTAAIEEIRGFTPVPEISVGPTPYEAEKAQEDVWE